MLQYKLNILNLKYFEICNFTFMVKDDKIMCTQPWHTILILQTNLSMWDVLTTYFLLCCLYSIKKSKKTKCQNIDSGNISDKIFPKMLNKFIYIERIFYNFYLNIFYNELQYNSHFSSSSDFSNAVIIKFQFWFFLCLYLEVLQTR